LFRRPGPPARSGARASSSSPPPPFASIPGLESRPPPPPFPSPPASLSLAECAIDLIVLFAASYFWRLLAIRL
jgi:hypothetical protein